MKPMRRLLSATAACVLLMPFALSAAVKTDYDHSVNFNGYKTFAWKMPPGGTADNGIVNNSIVGTRIQTAVNEDLMKKGMRENDANPDVYLVYHIGAKTMKDVDYVPGVGGYGWRRWGWMGPSIYTTRYTEGTIIIDMVDAHTNQLVWRAIGSDTGSTLLDVQKAGKIDKLVDSAFKHFPRKQREG